nr:hypothetical protein [Leptospira tipperaryensis]
MEVLRINLIYGETDNLFGLNIGLSNEVRHDLTGIQIGILNRAKNGPFSIQVGLYNQLDGVGYAIRTGLINYGGKNSMYHQNIPIYLLGGVTLGAINLDSEGGANVGIANLFVSGFNVGFLNVLTSGFTIGLINHGFGNTFSLGIINYCEFGPLYVMILANYCYYPDRE